MKTRPIPFNAPMVRALLDGSKTQTRRQLTLQNTLIDGERYTSRSQWWGRPAPEAWGDLDFAGAWVDNGPSPAGNDGPYLKVPYPSEGTVHRLYPAWRDGDFAWVREAFCNLAYEHEAPMVSYLASTLSTDEEGWASRLTLRVTDVRVQRVQDISEGDAMAEGVGPILVPPDGGGVPHVEGFHELWNSINGPDAWARNDWVWAVSFEVIHKNVDHV